MGTQMTQRILDLKEVLAAAQALSLAVWLSALQTELVNIMYRYIFFFSFILWSPNWIGEDVKKLGKVLVACDVRVRSHCTAGLCFIGSGRIKPVLGLLCYLPQCDLGSALNLPLPSLPLPEIPAVVAQQVQVLPPDLYL